MHDINRTMGDTTLEAYEGEDEAYEGEFLAEGAYEGEEESFEGEGTYEGEDESFEGEGAFEGETNYESTNVYAGEAYEGEAYEGEAYEGEAYEGEAYEGEAYEGEAYEGEAYEGEAYEGEAYEGEGEAYEGEAQMAGEDELNELAGELISSSSEQEIDRFLGRVVGSFVRGPVGQQLGGMLRNVARQTLPILGQALGNAVGGDAPVAGEVYGLETEGLSNEDADFEAAKQFVRMATDAAETAAQVPPGSNPADSARQALADAASRHAPGLLAPSGRRRRARAGRWVRQGDTLVVMGI